MVTRPIAVIIAIVLSVWSTEGLAQTPLSSTDGVNVDAASKRYSVESMLEKFGRARVIVQYKNVRSFESPIANLPLAHDRFAAVLGAPAAVAIARPIGSSPLVSARVDAAELNRLKSDANVVAIIPDIPIPPALFKSVSLIESPVPAADGPAPDNGLYAVAVLDTGIDENHPFLAQSILKDHAACFSTNDATFKAESLCPNKVEEASGEHSGNNCDPTLEICSHGTHVAGVIAGWAGKTIVNGTPISFSGVAPEVKIIPVQIYSMIRDALVCDFFAKTEAPCVLSFISNQASALDYVTRLTSKIRIAAVNVSLSFGSHQTTCDTDDIAQRIAPLIQNLRNLGVVTIVAAGNEGFASAIGFPACISSTISVAASDKQNQFVSSWPTGTGGSNFSSDIHFAAPGTEIVSSVVNSSYRAFSGTSVAAPHVTAVFAKTRALFPRISVDELENVLRKGATSSVSQGGVSKPIIRFSETELKTVAVPPVAAPASAAGTASATTLPPLPAPSAMLGHNRFIVDYGTDATVEQKTEVHDLLTKHGIDLNDIKPKSTTTDVISTDQPLDSRSFDALKQQGTVKDVFRDVPISGIQLR
jgi:subtilisin family serine protease